MSPFLQSCEVRIESNVRLLNQNLIEPGLATSRFVSGNQKNRGSLRVESERDA